MICPTLRSVAELRAHLDGLRAAGKKIGVVPTMGALHEGHLSLISAAAQLADEVVVTIFVNPTQFGPGEDFDRYPRTLDKDVQLSAAAGATAIFAPSVQEMYPPGEQTRVNVTGLSQGMCGVSRPIHFEGVATVVAKLFNVGGPGTYVFGKKDYQQWRLIERMAVDLLFPVKVVGCPIVREPDGLAMSSRNAYLSPEARAQAACLPAALQAALDAYRAGEKNSATLVSVVRDRLHGQVEVDYIEARDAESLQPVEGEFERPLLLALAVNLGPSRLIDNVVLAEETQNLLPALIVGEL